MPAHKLTKLTLLSFALLTILVLTACSGNQSGNPADSQGGDASVVGQADLIQQLESKGAQVETGETLEQPFFSVEAQILNVNGNDIQVFEYDTEEMRSGESGAISPDGAVGTTMITWIDQPNFWAKGKLIVLYVGTDKATIDLLTSILGGKITQ